MAIPEFVLRKLYVRDSLTVQPDGFSFALHNTFAPGTLTGFSLEVDGHPVLLENLSLQAEGQPMRTAASITPEDTAPLPVGLKITVRVSGVSLGRGLLTLRADTLEAGSLVFTIQAGASKPASRLHWNLRLLAFKRLLCTPA